MSAQDGRRSTLPPNADMAAELRVGTTIEDLAARLGVSVQYIRNRLNAAGWGSDGHPNHKEPTPGLSALFEFPPWVDRALCAQTDPEAFYPEKGGSTQQAKAVCARCPVSAECADYALANDERFGIWGGLSERERRRINRAMRAPGEPA